MFFDIITLAKGVFYWFHITKNHLSKITCTDCRQTLCMGFLFILFHIYIIYLGNIRTSVRFIIVHCTIHVVKCPLIMKSLVMKLELSFYFLDMFYIITTFVYCQHLFHHFHHFIFRLIFSCIFGIIII